MLELILDFLTELQSGRWTIHWDQVVNRVLNCNSRPNSFLCELSAFLSTFNFNAVQFTGSASSAVAAALATQGYYQQADVINLLNEGGALFGLAPLLYILSAVGGLIMLALGSPPKLYLWFLLGPAFYFVFLNWRDESMGNLYRIGSRVMPYSEVLEILHSNPMSTSVDVSDANGVLATYSEPASVSAIFAYIDHAVSSVVQALISAFTPPVTYEVGGNNVEGLWYHIGDYRWKLLETITSAKLSQADIRDAFITFLSSECGGVLRKYLSYPRYFAAKNAKNSVPPETVFVGYPGDLVRDLNTTRIPVPINLKGLLDDIFRNNSVSNFNKFSFAYTTMGTTDRNLGNLIFSSEITCAQILRIVMAALRAEAGYTYAKLTSQTPILIPRFNFNTDNSLDSLFELISPTQVGPVTASELGREIFGYWNLPFINGLGWNFNVGSISVDIRGTVGDPPPSLLTALFGENQENELAWMQFMIDVITAYIFKNELLFAPPLLNDSGGDPNTYTTAATANVASVGSVSKFGEIYVWSKMLPQVQGLFLYWLALGFPLAVVLMVIPNFQKAVLTWTLFWAWVKSWDIGFTLVKRLEPTLWSLVGRLEFLPDTLERIARIPVGESAGNGFSALTNVLVFCFSDDSEAPRHWPPCFPDSVPVAFVRSATKGGGILFEEAILTLDLGLATHNALWLEEGNAFYLYLIAAMYFAVPVIMGQLILGSKAALANIVKDFTGQITGDAARAAGQAYASQRQAQSQAVGASFNQAETLKSMRAGALASRAIAAQNLALRSQIQAGVHEKFAEGLAEEARLIESGARYSSAHAMATIQRFNFPFSMALAMREGSQSHLANVIGSTMPWLFPAAMGRIIEPITHENAVGLFQTFMNYSPTDFITSLNSQPADEGINRTDGSVNGLNQGGITDGQAAGGGVRGRAGAGVGAGGGGGSARTWLSNATRNGIIAPTVENYLDGQYRTDGSISGFITDGQAAGGGGGGGAGAGAGAGARGGGGGAGSGPAYHSFSLYTLFSIIRSVADSIPMQFSKLAEMYGIDVTAEASIRGRDHKIEASLSNLQAGIFNQESSRLQQAAMFEAQSDAWLARANYANAVNPILSAYGASPISVGEKPTELMGAAWLGQLGEKTEQAARLVENNPFNKDTFHGRLRDQFEIISQWYGSAAMQNVYATSKLTPDFALGLGYLSLLAAGGAKNSETEKFIENSGVWKQR